MTITTAATWTPRDCSGPTADDPPEYVPPDDDPEAFAALCAAYLPDAEPLF